MIKLHIERTNHQCYRLQTEYSDGELGNTVFVTCDHLQEAIDAWQEMVGPSEVLGVPVQ